MALFCLVHGSTQTSAGWALLAAELESRRQHCLCVDLPADRPDAGADVFADVIAGALRGSEPAILVAHSFSGLLSPLVPARIPVARLVFLAAVIPQPGKSFLQQYQATPEMYRPDFVGKDPTRDESLALQYLFHDCEPKVAAWALSTLRLTHAKQVLAERFPLDSWPNVPFSYISCIQDRAINPDWWEQATRNRLGIEPIRIHAGHAPQVSRPAELAEILIRWSG